MKRKLTLIKSSDINLTNVVFLDKARITNVNFKKIDSKLITEKDKKDLICYEINRRTRKICALIKI